MATSSTHKGWKFDQDNSRLDIMYNGVRVGSANANGVAVVGTLSSTTALTSSTSIAATTTVTGGTGVIATTGDVDTTAGNFRAGVKSAFATTEPTSALVMKTGTAPAGAITTSGGLFSSATVVQKIIAAGTVSNVET